MPIPTEAFPGEAELDRKQQFARLLHFVSARHGWIVSVPGADMVTVECLPFSTLPEDLRELGYRPEPAGEGERILAAAITEHVLTEGSTVPIIIPHAGITKVERYMFSLR